MKTEFKYDLMAVWSRQGPGGRHILHAWCADPGETSSPPAWEPLVSKDLVFCLLTLGAQQIAGAY